jgi:uncharacterized protein (TIGR03435 family)
MRKRNVCVLAVMLALSMQSAAHAQSPRPQFEVASVKASPQGRIGGQLGRAPGGRLTASNVPLALLIQNAYRVRPFQVIGGPDWMTTDRWDIDARAEEGSIPPQAGPSDPNVADPYSLRLQSLLEDRFKLRIRRETRDLPIFELTVAKGGLKAKLSDDQSPFRPPERGAPPPPPPSLRQGRPMPRGSISLFGGGGLQAAAIPFVNFAATLSQIVGRTVVDKTELKGLYDFDLKWTPDAGQTIGPPGPLPRGVETPPIDPSGASLVTALQEQLGLKLESSKGPVEVLVIDSVSRPSEN